MGDYQINGCSSWCDQWDGVTESTFSTSPPTNNGLTWGTYRRTSLLPGNVLLAISLLKAAFPSPHHQDLAAWRSWTGPLSRNTGAEIGQIQRPAIETSNRKTLVSQLSTAY